MKDKFFRIVQVLFFLLTFGISVCLLDSCELEETAGDVFVDTVFEDVAGADASDIQAPPVPDWNADEKCGQYIGYWHCSCKSGACCPGCDETWKTMIKVSGDSSKWVFSVTDVTEVDSVSYDEFCQQGMDGLDFENGKLYAISSPTDPATKKVFECVPAN